MINPSYAKILTEWLRVANLEGEPVEVLSLRNERALFSTASQVLKVHADDTDAKGLDARLKVIEEDPWRNLFLRPDLRSSVRASDGRILTLWPRAKALDINSEDIPWEEAARLLARMHSIPVDEGLFDFPLPKARSVQRWENAIAGLDDIRPGRRDRDWQTVCETVGSLDLPDWLFSKNSWIHGDWHLGQLVKTGESWRMIDLDDMGVGEPLWDLARPAAFFASGLLPAEDWGAFISSYIRNGGMALRGESDIWQRLNAPAICLTVQCAAVALTKAQAEDRRLKEDEKAFVASCERILRLRNLA